jgi:two-component system phosphate regulon response regulator PhoB
MLKLLIVNNGRGFADQLCAELGSKDIAARAIEPSNSIRENLTLEKPDAVVVALRNKEEIEFCRAIHRFPATRNLPIVLVTDRALDGPRITRQEAGANEFISKPFDPGDLIALVRGVAHRAQGCRLEVGDVVLDLAHRCAFREGRRIELQPVQLRLLQFFMERPTEVFTPRQVLGCVWGHNPKEQKQSFRRALYRLRYAMRCPDRAPVIPSTKEGGYVLLPSKRGKPAHPSSTRRP